MSNIPLDLEPETDAVAVLKEENTKANSASYLIPVIFVLLIISVFMAYAAFSKNKKLEKVIPEKN